MFTNETDRMLADGGVMQEGGTVDPVSGNDVPPGAMQEEVRDDIDAKLSEGEFVIPADVVRYIGLSTLMKMRDKAKEGLKKMEDIGQMGNAEEVSNAEALHGGESEEMDDESFGSEVDSILGEEEGMPAFAEGGYVDPANAPLYKSSPLKGFEMVTMVNESGNTIYIPHLNGKPLLAVPAGYSPRVSALPPVAETPTTTATPTTSGTGDSGGGGGDNTPGGVPGSQPVGDVNRGFTVDENGIAIPNVMSSTLGKYGGGFLGGLFGGMPGAMLGSKAGEKGVANINEMNALNAAGFNMSREQSNFRASEIGAQVGLDFDSTRAAQEGRGVEGTLGASASAGASAAADAVAAGYSDEAAGAAAQAAANAVMDGASAVEAAEAGRAAAQTVANDIDARDASAGYASPSAPGVAGSNDTTAAADNSGNTTSPDGAPGVAGSTNETAAADNSGNTSGSDSGFGTGGGYGNSDYGGYLNKGGFITKKNKPVATKSKKGLASRK